MSNISHTYVLAIGGLDPTGGAGILADVKAIHHVGGYAFAAASGLTAQDENRCWDCWWYDAKDIIKQIQPLILYYDIKVVKIGAVGTLSTLKQVLSFIKIAFPKAFVIWDPVLTSSSGKTFLSDWSDWWTVTTLLDLITPNIPECLTLSGVDTLEGSIERIAPHVPMYVKAGHQESDEGVEYFVTSERITKIKKQLTLGASKHGSGCVFASTVAAHIALGKDLLMACQQASEYMSRFINSHPTKLGLHVR